MSTVIKIICTGIGATLIVDAWTIVLRLLKIKSLDYRYVGRWIAYFTKGRFYHKNIMSASPFKGELLIGWTAHYFIGISFSFLLILLFGKEWLERPVLYQAVIIGIITLAAPLFIMQPAFGFGVASSNLPDPYLKRFKSLMTHIVYGAGLYLTAQLLKQVWN